MSQKQDTSEFPITTSGKNTNLDNHKNHSDLDQFAPAPAPYRLDDKAAQLEEDIQSLKAGFRKERFVYVFIINTLFLLLVGSLASNLVTGMAVTASLIFLIGMGNYLEFPWMINHLERWHNLWYKWCEKRISGTEHKEEDTEPL
jgi:hypothetical protein